jgi:hypothetical protein
MKEALERMEKEAHEGKEVYQVSQDTTAIEVRENGEKEEPKEKKRCGRPKPLLRERYMETVEISFENRNRTCAHGCKKNSHGNTQYLSGYKVHLEVSDKGFRLSALVSGANDHDSQFAIPFDGYGL